MKYPYLLQDKKTWNLEKEAWNRRSYSRPSVRLKKYRKQTFEEIAAKLVKDAYDQTENDEYAVVEINQNYRNFKKVQLKKTRRITLEGTGLALIEYLIKPRPEYRMVRMENSEFLSTELSEKIAAVAVTPEVPEKGKHGRLFVIEKENGGEYGGIL